MASIKDLPREEYLLPGNASCPGCGAMIGLKLALKIYGKNTILVIPACCSTVIQAVYPKTAIKVPVLNIAFMATGATGSGVAEALIAKGLKDVKVLCWAGDGGTIDIGIQALSGAAERGHDFLYICYNNEAYMNTGIQRSGGTPLGAWTTTTPTGKKEFAKDITLIMAAHHIPYVANANIAYPLDYIRKLKKSLEIKGPKFIHLLCPCPVGWRFPSDQTVKIGRLATQTWVWPLYEVENGVFKLNMKPKKIPVEEYLKLQGRYAKVDPAFVEKMQKWIDDRMELLLKYDEIGRIF